MGRLATANVIINRAAVEVGLFASTDPVASGDETFVQMEQLLNSAGQELVELHAWQVLQRNFKVVTTALDTGVYDLPDDFSYMIDQTGWERSNRVAMGGPLSPQDWSYLEGRDLVSESIYASFRLSDNKFEIYPQDPVPAALDINFMYISRNWVLESNGTTYKDQIGSGNDVVLFSPIMIIKFLKAKFLEAKGFDASSARLEFENMFNSRTGKDEGAPILSASSNTRGFPYLSPYGNTSDTGFGG